MKFRYTFERAGGSLSSNTLATDAEAAVENTVAALDPSHGTSPPRPADRLVNAAESAGRSALQTVVAFEVADTISLDQMRNLLASACARQGVVCIDIVIQPPNPMAGLPGGDAG